MPGIAEFTDPRLVAIYDTVNQYGENSQPQFYLQLAGDLAASSILDLGCGTGLITCEFARLGYRVTGVDPSPAMLAIARIRPYGDRVHWVDGGVSRLGSPGADLAIMTGHVAQFFLSDDSWQSALSALSGALRPGGRLAFETRNPAAREWQGWTPESRSSADDPALGRIESWSEFHELRDGIVSYTNHYAVVSTGEELVSPGRMRFRSEEELRRSLAEAGFVIERLYGDWDRRPAGRMTRELIIVATR